MAKAVHLAVFVDAQLRVEIDRLLVRARPRLALVDLVRRVDESKTGTGTDEKTVYLYSELRADENCKMYRLGYTRAEVENILEAGK